MVPRLFPSLLLVGTISGVFGRIGARWEELTASTFENFVTSGEHVAVDFYDSEDPDYRQHEQELNDAIVMVRNSGNMRLLLAKVDAKKETGLAEKYVKNGMFPQLVWFIHGLPTKYHRTIRSAKRLADFINALDRPALTQVFDSDAAADYNRAVLAEVSAGPMRQALEVVALKHMDTLAVMYMDGPGNTVSWFRDGEKTATFAGEPSAEALELWVKAQMPFKSEDVPEGGLPMEGASHMVVAKNFEQMVLRDDKDVMLLVHTPWCGFCKKMEPAWEQFALAMQAEPNMLVAKLDGDRNDSPLPDYFLWDSFPMIFYVNAGKKAPVVYRGNATFESLVSFAQEHTSKPLAGAGAGGSLVSDSAFDL